MSDLNENFASYFSADDVAMLQEFIDEHLTKGSMTAKEIYEKFKDKTTQTLTESVFRNALGGNVRCGYIVGVEGRRRIGYVPVPRETPKEKPDWHGEERQGRGGRGKKKTVKPAKAKPEAKPTETVSKPESEPESESESEIETVAVEPELPKRERKPLPPTPRYTGYHRYLWVRNRMYKVPYPRASDVSLTITKVMNCKQDAEGNITYKGKTWKCDDEAIFERMITTLWSGSFVTACAPVVDDGTGVAVELRIDSGQTHVQIDQKLALNLTRPTAHS